jgi:ribosomal protein L29
MEQNTGLSLDEKKKLLFFLKINAQSKELKNRSLIAKLRKEIARETCKQNGKVEKLG